MKLKSDKLRWRFYELCGVSIIVFRCTVRVEGGGLAFLWNTDVDLIIKSYSTNHVDMVIAGDSNEHRVTFFDGHPDVSRRNETCYDV